MMDHPGTISSDALFLGSVILFCFPRGIWRFILSQSVKKLDKKIYTYSSLQRRKFMITRVEWFIVAFASMEIKLGNFFFFFNIEKIFYFIYSMLMQNFSIIRFNVYRWTGKFSVIFEMKVRIARIEYKNTLIFDVHGQIDTANVCTNLLRSEKEFSIKLNSRR